MSSAVRATWRTRSASGSRLIRRVSAHANGGATTTVQSVPSLASSSLTPTDLYLSIAGFVVFYTVLFIIEIMLMFKYARLGPSSLHTGRYHHEQQQPLNQSLPTNTAA